MTNPSIGEVSLGASLSLGSGCHLDERDGASSAALIGARSAASSSLAGCGGAVGGSASVAGGPAGGSTSAMGNECDRESASNTAIAGSVASAPFAGVVTSGSVGGGSKTGHPGGKLEIGADVHSSRSKKFSLSSETVSLSVGDNASTKALAGSILAYR